MKCFTHTALALAFGQPGTLIHSVGCRSKTLGVIAARKTSCHTLGNCEQVVKIIRLTQVVTEP